MAHILSEINPKARMAICSECGPVAIRAKGKRNGKQRWRCKVKHLQSVKRYKNSKLAFCERCGFVPEDKCQLDVHRHREANVLNRVTLCANCHRIISKWEREGKPIAIGKLRKFS